MNPNSERAHEHFEDNFLEIAERYFNDDRAGDLSLIGEFVLNNPRLFTAFVEEWAALPENSDKVRDWFMESLPEAEREDMPGGDR